MDALSAEFLHLGKSVKFHSEKNMQPKPCMAREALQERLIFAAESIIWDQSSKTYNMEAVNKFLDVWRELVEYYENCDDDDIGVEVVREFLNWRFHLAVAKNSEGTTEIYREDAKEALTDLEAFMEMIITAVTRRRHPSGR